MKIPHNDVFQKDIVFLQYSSLCRIFQIFILPHNDGFQWFYSKILHRLLSKRDQQCLGRLEVLKNSSSHCWISELCERFREFFHFFLPHFVNRNSHISVKQSEECKNLKNPTLWVSVQIHNIHSEELPHNDSSQCKSSSLCRCRILAVPHFANTCEFTLMCIFFKHDTAK